MFARSRKAALLVLCVSIAAISLLAAGCGGGGGKSASPSPQATAPAGGGGGGGGGPYTVEQTAVCLTDENWLIQPESDRITGTSPGGVPVAINFYGSAAEAKAKGGAKKKAFGNAVITFKQPGAGEPGLFTSKATPVEIAAATKTIKSCLK